MTMMGGEMSTAAIYPHINLDGDGTARIRMTRCKVEHLAAKHFHYGWTAEELLRQHPDLRHDEVCAALTYFYDHHDERVCAMRAASHSANAARGQQTLSRAELLSRTSG